MSEAQAMNYPIARAFALRNFCIENNPMGGRFIYESPGYLGQEIEKVEPIN